VAAGAPIQIPARFEDQGRPLDDVTAEINSRLREECGGDLCVTLLTEQQDVPGYTRCSFYETLPPQRSFVQRGSTVTIVSGAEPCEGETDGGTPPTSDGPGSSTNLVPEEPTP
jgi:hypothetical protein